MSKSIKVGAWLKKQTLDKHGIGMMKIVKLFC